jgi:formylglycine-generating enzyme required for sulfatase activity
VVCPRVAVAFVSCALAAGVGCSLLVDTGGLSGPPDVVDGATEDVIAADANDSSTLDAGSDAPKACPSGRGPNMIVVGGPGVPFCIDATEVTNSQFREMLVSPPALSTLPVSCAFKTAFASAVGPNDLPVNTDWCDGYAFCAWAGKRLCGKIGGGANDFADYAQLSKSQWYYACSGGGVHVYPYGDTFDPLACNGAAYDAGGVIPVKSDPRCEGGFPGLFDMAGNRWEWEDSCTGDGGADDRCRARGGTWVDGNTQMQCDFDHLKHFDPRRNQTNTYMGFRCCAD